MKENFFKESQNCWKIEKANRASVIIDGENYFRAVYESMTQAQSSIMIVGWDIHSELSLIRNGDDDKYRFPRKLGKLLNFLIKKRKQLRIYLLSWDFSMIYALEREFFPKYKLKWRSHNRIHFCLDGKHPVGGSQHQKLVVVDDKVAFAGGFDLSKWRWDSSEHKADDKRRLDPDGKPYRPFHDVQMVLDGPAAGALGKLARDRWERAFSEKISFSNNNENNDPWPESVEPQFKDIEIAIARTMPLYKDFEEIREVEQLYLDSINQAEKYLYIENQYLSSYRIGEALKESLEKENGPEIVIIMPKKTEGWLEQNTMGVLRSRIMRKLKDADKNKRLRIFYKKISDNPELNLMIHAKLMVIDNCFLRVGSSNLSNRSLGLDSECDLAVFAKKDTEESKTIANFRNTLLAEHLGKETEEIENTFNEKKSLIKTIEFFNDKDKNLIILDDDISEEIDQLIPDHEVLDPEKPIEPEKLFNHFISQEQQSFTYRHLLKIITLFGLAIALAVIWRWTSLNEWMDIDNAINVAESIKQYPLAPFIVILVFILLGFVSFPITILIIATVIIFGPWLGTLYSYIGAVLNAISLFLIGRWTGQETVARFAGSLLNRLNDKLSKSGFFAVITFRIIPVAPYSVINLIAGVSKIRLKDFVLGTLVGLIPGLAAIVIITNQISETIENYDITNIALSFGSIILVAIGLIGLRKWLRKNKK